MSHPYAPWIVATLASVIAACWVQIWATVRTDRREKKEQQR